MNNQEKTEGWSGRFSRTAKGGEGQGGREAQRKTRSPFLIRPFKGPYKAL